MICALFVLMLGYPIAMGSVYYRSYLSKRHHLGAGAGRCGATYMVSCDGDGTSHSGQRRPSALVSGDGYTKVKFVAAEGSPGALLGRPGGDDGTTAQSASSGRWTAREDDSGIVDA